MNPKTLTLKNIEIGLNKYQAGSVVTFSSVEKRRKINLQYIICTIN